MLSLSAFASTELVLDENGNPPPIEPIGRNPIGVTVDETVSVPRVPEANDEIAKSVVSIGIVIKDKSLFPNISRSMLPPANHYLHQCTLTVVSPKALLGAAHCLGTLKELASFMKITFSSNSDLIKKLQPYVSFVMVPTHKTSSTSHLLPGTINIVDLQEHPSYIEGVRTQNEELRKAYDTGFFRLAEATDIPSASVVDARVVTPANATLRTFGYNWIDSSGKLKYTEAHVPQNYEKSFTAPDAASGFKDVFVKMQTGQSNAFGENPRILIPTARHRNICGGSSGGPTAAYFNGKWQIIAVNSGGASLGGNCGSTPLPPDHRTVGQTDIGDPTAKFEYEEAPALATQGDWFYQTLYRSKNW